jgi:hypothetical protein
MAGALKNSKPQVKSKNRPMGGLTLRCRGDSLMQIYEKGKS